MGAQLARLLPLSGIAFVLTMVGIIAMEGEELSASATSKEVLAHWADRADGRLITTTLSAFAALFLAAFASVLRSTLRSREPAEASASAIAFAGGVIASGALVVSGMVSLSAARAGGNGDAAAVVPLDHLMQSTWVPLTGGLGVLLLAVGVGALFSGALHKALGWPAVVLGLCLLTPAGLVGFLLSPVWVVVVSVVLFRRAARPRSRTPGAAPPSSS